MKLKLITILFIFLSSIAFLIEKSGFEDSQQLTYLKHFTQNQKNKELAFHKKVIKRLENDVWTSTFFQGKVSARKMKRLAKFDKTISAMALINKRGVIFAEYKETLTMNLLKKYFFNTKHIKKKKYVFLEFGRFCIYPVKRLDNKTLGYVLFKFKLNSKNDENIMAIADASRAKLYFSPSDYFSKSDKLEIKENLQNLAWSDSGQAKVNIDSVTWQIHWTMRNDQNYYYISFRKEPMLTSYVGFYLLTSSVFVFLLLLILSHPSLKKLLSNEETKEKINAVLTKQKNSLESLQDNFNVLQESFLNENTIREHEKVVMGHTLEKSQRDVPADKVYEVGKRDIENLSEESDNSTIELTQLKREFIFLEPTDVSWRGDIKTESLLDFSKENEVVENLRERTFSPEVVDLIKDISADEKVESIQLFDKIDKLESKHRVAKIDPFQVSLNEVYFDEVTLIEIENLLSLFSTSIKATGMIMVNFNSYLACYEPVACHNLPKDLLKTAYLLPQDPLIKLRNNMNMVVRINDKKKENIFFKKRLGNVVSQKVEYIYSISLHAFHLDSYLLGFYYNKEDQDELHQIPKENIEHYLEAMVPALKFYFMGKDRVEHVDQTKEIVKEIRLFTNINNIRATILHIRPKVAMSETQYDLLFNKLADRMHSYERLIFNTPGHLILLLNRDHEKKVLAIIHQELEDVEILAQPYPESGTSYYSYL